MVTAARIAVGSGRATAKLREADGVFNQALDHYKKGRPGSPNFNHHLAQAATLFDKAFDIYEAAQKMEPNNRMIDNRMTDCQKYGYHARKMQTLGGF